MQAPQIVPLLNTGIAWPSDKENKFRNPEGNFTEIIMKTFAKPLFWSKELYELDTENPANNGFQVNQSFHSNYQIVYD